MAFNWQTFRTRAGTAAIFVAVMLAGLLWNQWSFFVLFSVIHFGCWWEYFLLLERIYRTSFHSYVKLGLMLIGYGLMIWFTSGHYFIGKYELAGSFSLPISAAGFVMIVLGIFQKNIITAKSYMAAALGVLYISLSWGSMMWLYCHAASIDTIDSHKLLLPVVMIVSIWINDTMAYIMGSFIGKTPLSKISPKKTWEGTIAGIILAVVTIGSFLNYAVPAAISSAQPAINWFVIPAIAAIAGTFGDLLESKLKRMAGVKDSGQIMRVMADSLIGLIHYYWPLRVFAYTWSSLPYRIEYPWLIIFTFTIFAVQFFNHAHS